MKTKIGESCLDFLFGGEFWVSRDSSSPRDEEWVLLMCGICVVSLSSTLDSTSKIKAACFLSSAFCWMGLLQARKQACCAALRDPQCFCLQAFCILHLSIHTACSFCVIPRYVIGPLHHWALHSWIQSFTDQNYSQKGLHLWWAGRNSYFFGSIRQQLFTSIYIVLVL